MKRKNKLDPRKWYILPDWDELPLYMQNDAVRMYYNELKKHETELRLKRTFDLIFAWVLLAVFGVPMLTIAIGIKLDSYGPVLYRQKRVTTYGKVFYIHKFRTMVPGAERIGSTVTVNRDRRITDIGAKLRGMRLDELPQLFDVIEGTMSFVGTRPEVVKYVKKYKQEMMATLLLPAGITSEASIRYKNESLLLDFSDDVDNVYVEEILPKKMQWNLESIHKFCFFRDILTMCRTILAVLGKEYK